MATQVYHETVDEKFLGRKTQATTNFKTFCEQMQE
jgi:hypothetical protein